MVRVARQEDAGFLAQAMLAASRGHLARGWYDIALDAPESRCLEFLTRLATAKTPSWWHYSHFLIVEAEGEPAGTLGAFRAGDAFGLSGAASAEAAAAIGLSDTEQAAIWQRGSYLFLCALGRDDSWTLDNVYTAPQYRGRGLMGNLIAYALEEGRDLGFDEAQITFFIGNETAEHVYRKAGFAFAEEKIHPDFEAVAGAPGLRRVVRRLNPS